MEWVARLVDQVSPGTSSATAGVKAFRTELAAASAELKAFEAAGGRLGGTAAAAGGGLTEAAAGAQATTTAATNATKAAAGAAAETAAAGQAIKPVWAQTQAQAQAATGALGATGKAAGAAGAAAGAAGKAAAGAGNAAAKAGGKAAGGLLSASKAAEGALGAVRNGATLLLGALGIAGATSVLKLALGARGMQQLDAITARTQTNVRLLFSRVDPSPVVRAYNRFSQLFSTSTVTGKALGDVFTRSFNTLFSAVEKAEPYITAFAQGALLGFLYIENAVLRARVALAPYTGALDGVVSSTTLLSIAANVGTIALGGIVDTARLGVAVFDGLGSAASKAGDAIARIAEAAREWQASGFDGAGLAKFVLGVGDALPSGTADGPAAAKVRPRGAASSPATAPATALATAAGASTQAAAAKGASPQAAAAAGQATGAAMAQGMVAGMNGGQAAVTKAGADLAAAADKGVRDKAEIRSPSRLFRRTAEYMPEGTVQGLRAGSDDVQRASDALVPQPPGAAPKPGAAHGPTVIHIGRIEAPHVFDPGGLASFVRGVAQGETIHALESLGVPA